VPSDLSDRVEAVGGLTHDEQVVFSIEDHPQAGAYELLVVDDQNPERHGC
jgi:hypothetical protein